MLNLLPQGTNPGPVLDPTGLIFTTEVGAENPASQDIGIYNIGADVISFGAGAITVDERTG